jgi:hypothetical protein
VVFRAEATLTSAEGPSSPTSDSLTVTVN